MTRIFILGANDPEMEAIRKNVPASYYWIDAMCGEARVTPATAYQADDTIHF